MKKDPDNKPSAYCKDESFDSSLVNSLLLSKSSFFLVRKSGDVFVTFTALSVARSNAFLRSVGKSPPLSLGIFPHFQVPFFCLSHLQTSLLLGSLSEQNDVFLSFVYEQLIMYELSAPKTCAEELYANAANRPVIIVAVKYLLSIIIRSDHKIIKSYSKSIVAAVPNSSPILYSL